MIPSCNRIPKLRRSLSVTVVLFFDSSSATAVAEAPEGLGVEGVIIGGRTRMIPCFEGDGRGKAVAGPAVRGGEIEDEDEDEDEA